MKKRNPMKVLGTAAVIIMILVCLLALAVAVLSLLTGENPMDDILSGGVLIEKRKDEALAWQTENTEGDIKAEIKTGLGSIVFKIRDEKAAEYFLSEPESFAGAVFDVAAKDLFVQTSPLSKASVPYEESALGCFYGAVGLVSEEGKTYPSLVIIAAEELSGLSRAYISGENFDEERAEFYKSFGGVPEYEGKIQIFGQVTEGFDVLLKIAEAKTSGYTAGFAPEEPVTIISVKVTYPETSGRLE